MAKFKDRLKSLRLDRGLSLQDLAKYLKISKSTVNMYERGERHPDFEQLEAIADFFNVDMNYLLGYSDYVTRICCDETSTSGATAMLTVEELALVRAYRQAGDETKAAVRAVLHMETKG